MEEVSVFLDAKNISKNYGGVLALKDVDIEIRKGEVHSLVGENGSGKSTLVKVLTGVIQPEAGAEITIEGTVRKTLSPLEAFRLGIHVVHQDLSLFPNTTVAENIAIHRYTEKGRLLVNWREIHDLAERSLKEFGLDIEPSIELGKLPLADQQLVAICRALASDAKLIILDEPTSSLTRKEVNRLFAFINSLKDGGISTLFISHRLGEVLEISDRITVLRDGKKIGTFNRDELSKNKLAYLMTGRQIAQESKVPQLQSQEVVLEVKNLSREGQFSNINFAIYKGEILGIIGPKGAGRTELALSLFGMNKYDSGEIIFKGKHANINSNRDAIKRGIAYVPENRLVQGIILPQPIMYNIIITNFKKVLGKLSLVNRRLTRVFAEDAVKVFGIKAPSVEAAARTLSGGNQQKVVLAKWILTSPEVLILDGPTIGIDIAAKESIFNLVHELSAKGVSIILISDEPSEVIYNSHRILLMKNGKIVAEYLPQEIDEEELERSIKE